MDDSSRSPNGALAGFSRARAVRVFTAVALALIAYAAWRGYQNPDFLIRIGAAFGLC